MKSLLTISSIILLSAAAFAQKDTPRLASKQGKGCDNLYVDLNKGTLNGVKPSATMQQVKKALPCFTGETSEAEEWLNCGGGVFFLKHDFYFYTGKDFIELRKDFKGKMSVEVFGKTEDEIRKLFGEPVRVEEEYNMRYLFFKMSYGALVINIAKDGVREIDIYSASPEAIKLCL